MGTPKFSSEEHAYFTGAVIGMLMKNREDLSEMLSPGGAAEIIPELEDGDYLPSIIVTLTGQSKQKYNFLIKVEEWPDPRQT